MAKRILVVEDDRSISELVRSTLASEGYSVEIARDGAAGLATFKSLQPDLVVLDWMLPQMSGLEVLKEIRRAHQTPVLFLTVRDDETDKVVGLEMGADDYLTKPFGVRELAARVKALLRRRAGEGTPRERIEVGSLAIDLSRRLVTRDGRAVEMTRTEFELLASLASNPGIVFTRERLLETVWGYRFEGYQRTVDSHMTRLRKKIEDDPRRPSLIQTVWGVGYRFRAPSPDE
ncbi:MAG: response regulator transcription factor [Candidatus Riflebacteria bacterium]|nr:response regulator transcription factor [Candidatus Riflebacteria bacterium]